MLAKRSGLPHFEFSGGGLSKEGGVDLFREGEAEDFLQVIFNC